MSLTDRFSLETVEKIFFYATALHDLLDEYQGTAYSNGDGFDSVEQRRKEIRGNLTTRKSITQIRRGWRTPALKFRYEFLVVDVKCSEAWSHANTTLKELAVGEYVRRLELDAFDSSVVRLKSAARILQQCCNAQYVSLTFQDDSRRLRPYDMLVPAIQQINAHSLKHICCNFGKSFEQALIIQPISKFSSLRTMYIQSAFGSGSVSTCDMEALDLINLESLGLASTEDIFFRCMAEWNLPSLKDLSILYLKSAKTTNRFLRNHGFKIQSLQLTYIAEDSAFSTLDKQCPNLQELVVSLDGIPYSPEIGLTCPLSHGQVKRVGIRDICINVLTTAKTMNILNKIMQMFATPISFPRLQEITFLDFQRELWTNVAWRTSHVDLWMEWIEMCQDTMVKLRASDGKALHIGPGSTLRMLDSITDAYYNYL